MHKIRFRPGLGPEPRWGAYSAPPDPLAGLRGPTFKGRRGEGTGKEGRGGRRGRGETRNGGNGRKGVGMLGKGKGREEERGGEK